MNKVTKRTLVASLLVMVLSVVTLVGSTYAWFVDTSASKDNKIVAGNLDVNLYYTTDRETLNSGEGWIKVDEASDKMFSESVTWGPGQEQFVYFKIENTGALDAKYKLLLDITNEVTSTNVLGEELKLSDYIQVHTFGEVDGEETAEQLVYKASENGPDKSLEDKDSVYGDTKVADNLLLHQQEVASKGTVCGWIDLYMPTTVGQGANFETGATVPEITFDVLLVATQLESDIYQVLDENGEYTMMVSSLAELETAFTVGGNVTLYEDIVAEEAESIVIAEGSVVELDLNGHTITNPVVGAAALINKGTLTLSDGAIINGVNNTKNSHTIVNDSTGTLIINSGTYGTDDTAGAAVVNNGTATINGGTFASKQENDKADGLCAYVFINNNQGDNPVMTINDANVNCETHGLFGAYAGEIIVNGGNYTLEGNNGLGCYVAYAAAAGKVTINDGIIYTNEPRSNRVFFVYDDGNYFNENAVEHGNVVVGKFASIYLNGVEQNYYKPSYEDELPTENLVTITSENISNYAWNTVSDGATIVFEGSFDNIELKNLSALVGKNVVFDGRNATISGEVRIGGAPLHAAEDMYKEDKTTLKERVGNITVRYFNAKTLGVCFSNTSVAIVGNTAEFINYDGGNVNLTIDDNVVDGKKVAHTTYQNNNNEYGIYLYAIEYKLVITNNLVKNTKSHAIGINGRESEAIGKNSNVNVIETFANNKIIVSDEKAERAALKIWDCETYAPNGSALNDSAKSLIEAIMNSNNTFVKATNNNPSYVFDFFDIGVEELN